jgi:hypothetical protein
MHIKDANQLLDAFYLPFEAVAQCRELNASLAASGFYNTFVV